jgi:protocatechuate 3,4-dioxygenase beta subunit
MRTFYLGCLLLLAGNPGCGQQSEAVKPKNDQTAGGRCEGCEALMESPVPFAQLKPEASLPDAGEAGQKMEISGTVYLPDGKTPAPDVVIYVYHTDQKGLYTKKGNESGWGKTHGYIRGWVKTDKNGHYLFNTLRPVAYPGNKIPAHIHIIIKEPGITPYWIDEYLFSDDPILTETERSKAENRGGSGIVTPVSQKGIQKVKRDIFTGRNIPGYSKTGQTSYLQPGIAVLLAF